MSYTEDADPPSAGVARILRGTNRSGDLCCAAGANQNLRYRHGNLSLQWTSGNSRLVRTHAMQASAVR
jgi:hypothetical protein